MEMASVMKGLMTIHVNWMCHALNQGIRNIKTFTKYKQRNRW